MVVVAIVITLLSSQVTHFSLAEGALQLLLQPVVDALGVELV